MASFRRATNRMSGSIWPGFVDAMTALLLVLMFVLSIFMVIQSMLRDEITGQKTELDALTNEVTLLAQALGLEQRKSSQLENQVGTLRSTLEQARATAEVQAEAIATLQATTRTQAARLASFEEQVTALIAERDAALVRGGELSAKIEDLEAAQARLITEQEALQLALAKARDEIDVATEEARLAAAKREALDALIADLRAEAAEQNQALAGALDRAKEAESSLTEAEKEKLANAAALEALRERLKNSDAELTALTLSLEAARKEAEETLTLLAAAQAAQKQLEGQVTGQLSEGDRQAALLAQAKQALSEEEEVSAEAQRRVALLNQQVAELRAQLATLQATLDVRIEKDAENEVQLSALTSRLNAALAQVAAEERLRAELEEAERKRLEEEAKSLENYRSEFFGRLREILGDREGVRVVGDRFVFSSEVLFNAGSAELGAGGRAQIQRVASILSEVASEIPPEVDWVIRVDGHTDKVPLSGTGEFADNWELSQARALSVVRYMSRNLGFPPDRLLAAGFGEFKPVADGDTPAAYAQNRRIELKLTEK